MVVTGQTLRSTAMIHASSNFSHVVAFRKKDDHVLVTDGIYAYVHYQSSLLRLISVLQAGSAIRRMQASSIGRSALRLPYKILSRS
jgi:protein-S-isoprenylcysteine O-methyltransferase Ste14